MRRVGAIILAIALLVQANTAMAQTAGAAPPPPPSVRSHIDYRPIVIGLGAIAGVVIFNVAALGFEAVPGGLAYEAGATVPAEMSVAMSRVYATTAAVVGGLLAYYSFGR
jgi:hypothetical protein